MNTTQLDPNKTICIYFHKGMEVGRRALLAPNRASYEAELATNYKNLQVKFEESDLAWLDKIFSSYPQPKESQMITCPYCKKEVLVSLMTLEPLPAPLPPEVFTQPTLAYASLADMSKLQLGSNHGIGDFTDALSRSFAAQFSPNESGNLHSIVLAIARANLYRADTKTPRLFRIIEDYDGTPTGTVIGSIRCDAPTPWSRTFRPTDAIRTIKYEGQKRLLKDRLYWLVCESINAAPACRENWFLSPTIGQVASLPNEPTGTKWEVTKCALPVFQIYITA